MKYVKINIDSFRIKADLEDEEQITHDVYERVAAMIEAETLTFSIDEESEDDSDDC